MNVSAIHAVSSSQYADTIRAALAAKAQSRTAAPVDSDGDHDASSAAGGRLDVKA